VSEWLAELGIRSRLKAADLTSRLLARARCARGQTTVEWLAIMVGFTALVTILAGDDVWREAGKAVVDAVHGILGDTTDKV
jgi:hypothetical protein